MTDFSSFVSVEEIIIKFSFIRLIFFPNCFRYMETKAGKVLQGKNEDYFWIGFEMFFNNLVLGPQPIVRCPQSTVHILYLSFLWQSKSSKMSGRRVGVYNWISARPAHNCVFH